MSKTILITGTSTGFGKLMVETLAADGNSVIAGMRDVNGNNAVEAAELNSVANVEVVELDVNSDTSVNGAVQKVLKKYGGIDVFVQNAGIVGFGIFEGTSLENMKKLFETNVWGQVRGYQAVLPSMRERKTGLIINVSSGLGLFSTPYAVPYNMSKFAIQGLTEGVREEVKRFGIETITVLPGPFPTGIASKNGPGMDKHDVIDSYGAEELDRVQKFGGSMFTKIEEYKADPQEVADSVKQLIDMKPGTRPFETVVNRIGEGVEQRFADSKRSYYVDLMNNMGWGFIL